MSPYTYHRGTLDHKEMNINKIGEFLNSQGYDIDLSDNLWMEDYRFSEHKVRDICELLHDYSLWIKCN